MVENFAMSKGKEMKKSRAAPMAKMARAASAGSCDSAQLSQGSYQLEGAMADADAAQANDLAGLGVEAEDAQEEESKQAVEQPKEPSAPVDNWRQPGPVPEVADTSSMPKPSFREVINCQISAGCWPLQARNTLSACIVGGSIDDATIEQALSTDLDADLRQTAYLTLLAWYILAVGFEDNESEWKLIVNKAKTWLEQTAKVSKPARLIKKIKLQLKQ